MTESFVAAKKKRIIIGIASAGVVLAVLVTAVLVGSSTKVSSPGATITSAPASINLQVYMNTQIDPAGIPMYKVGWTAPTTGAADVTGYRVSCSGTGCEQAGHEPIVEGSTKRVEKILFTAGLGAGAYPVAFQVSAITATGDTEAISISKVLTVTQVFNYPAFYYTYSLS